MKIELSSCSVRIDAVCNVCNVLVYIIIIMSLWDTLIEVVGTL